MRFKAILAALIASALVAPAMAHNPAKANHGYKKVLKAQHFHKHHKQHRRAAAVSLNPNVSIIVDVPLRSVLKHQKRPKHCKY